MITVYVPMMGKTSSLMRLYHDPFCDSNRLTRQPGRLIRLDELTGNR